MQDGELKEIGEIVFKDCNIWKEVKHFKNISDIIISGQIFPLNKYLTYLFNTKIVIDTYNNKVWTFSKFKKHINSIMDEEYEYQKELNALKNKLIDDNKLNNQTEDFLELSLKDSQSRIEDAQKKIRRLSIDISKYQQTNIEELKKIPITNYIDFGRNGFCKCVWPGHDDKTPSMKYYPKTNTVNCFSCHHSGDVIDVVMAVHNTDFKGAIKILSNK